MEKGRIALGGGAEPAEIAWTERGAPRSVAFDDIYFNEADGRAESAHVFLGGARWPEAWRGRDRVAIAELGFGIGLNCLLTEAAWRGSGAPVRVDYVGFERAPPEAAAIRRALAPWPDLDADGLLADWPPPSGVSRKTIGAARGAAMTLELHIGAAAETVPAWKGAADIWFLDGFSPAKNPDLWSQELMRVVFERTAPGGVFATYAAAGWVRRNLAAAGFDVERRPGFGLKRHMSAGRKPT